MIARVLSGLVLAGGITAILTLGPVWALGIVVVVFWFIAAGEFLAMARPDATPGDKVVFRLATAIPVAFPIIVDRIPFFQHGTALLVAFFLLAFWRLARPDPIEAALPRLSAETLGLLYIGVTFPIIFILRDSLYGGWTLLMVMAITFLGDTGGYFAGRFFGKHKLYAKISPKKTMEGAVGGILLATGGAFFARAFFPGHDVLSVIDCVALGAGGAVFGILGDLVESMFKRSSGVKDSGSIIPGHGGILDRIDGLLFVGPFCWAYLELVRP